jgi:exopolysaccharide biosynthesis protein
MAAQKPDAPSNSGMSLPALTTFMQERLGVKQAMNLDGGSSSALFYEGKTVYGKVDPEGQPIQRAVKSVILVQE